MEQTYSAQCPECKNPIDLSGYTDLTLGKIIECKTCGMTLEVSAIANDGVLTTTIVDEGK